MTKRKSKSVEIYFILYLAAIIFLLPDKKTDTYTEVNGTRVLKSEFTLQPIKTSLNCRFYFDSTGFKVLSMDSINTILFTGDVEDVRFKFEIEDIALRQKQVIRSTSKYFRYSEDIDNHELKFIWEPPKDIRENKTYIIKVIATAKSKDRGGVRPVENIYNAETEFSLIMTDVSKEVGSSMSGQNLFPVTNVNLDGQPVDVYNRYSQLQAGVINLAPKDLDLKALAYQNWSNQILVFGANPSLDLIGKPKVSIILDPIDNNGKAELSEIGPTFIKISGRTPSHGKMKVIVTAKFRFNNEMTEEFWVSPLTIKRPDFESVVYPEKSYVISPNLPYKSGWHTEVFIKDKGKIQSKSEQGEPLTFKPELSQIGRVLSLERYINDSLYDQYEIKVLDYPDPVITDLQNPNYGEVIIVTKSYGSYKAERNTVKLETSGNVRFREVFGKSQDSPDEITITQRFKAEPKDIDKPFVFEVTSVDKRGRKSQTKKFSAND